MKDIYQSSCLTLAGCGLQSQLEELALEETLPHHVSLPQTLVAFWALASCVVHDVQQIHDQHQCLKLGSC